MRDSLAGGSIHLAMGTYGVAAIRTLAEAHAKGGQVLVAGPVLGRPDLAASGQLGIVAAGPQESVKRMRALADVDRPPNLPVRYEARNSNSHQAGQQHGFGRRHRCAGRSIFAGT